MSKRVIRQRYGCKKHHLKAYPVRQQGQLSTDRIVGERAFEVIGTNLLDPITIKQRKAKETRIRSSCSPALWQELHLELLLDQTTKELLKQLKWLIAQKGCPTVIYTVKAKSFIDASKWI